MRREGFQIAVHGLQTVEWLFTAERRAGGFNRFSTVHTHESVQVLQWLAILFLRKQQQGLQGAWCMQLVQVGSESLVAIGLLLVTPIAEN